MGHVSRLHVSACDFKLISWKSTLHCVTFPGSPRHVTCTCIFSNIATRPGASLSSHALRDYGQGVIVQGSR